MYGGHFLVSWSLTAPSSRPWSSRQPLAASLDPYSGFLWIKPPYHTPPRLDPRLPTPIPPAPGEEQETPAGVTPSGEEG